MVISPVQDGSGSVVSGPPGRRAGRRGTGQAPAEPSGGGWASPQHYGSAHAGNGAVPRYSRWPCGWRGR